MKLILPLSVQIPRKKSEDRVFHLNLNTYRNTHHMTLNQAKVLYKEAVQCALLDTDPRDRIKGDAGPLSFTYTLFPATNRACDLANVLTVVQKFTDDALIEFGVIPDDNYNVVRQVSYRFGGVDRRNPRVELEISRMEG